MVDVESDGAPLPLAGFAGLRSALSRLDAILDAATASARDVYGSDAVTDRFRGLYISDADAAALLRRAPGASLFGSTGPAHDEPPQSTGSVTLDWLRTACDLTSFDLDVILLAAAPEIDLRYERLYAYLQDDVTRHRPTVDLACQLFCPTDESRIAARRRLAPDAPLLRYRLIEIAPESPARAFLASTIALDGQIAALLLDGATPDRRIADYVYQLSPHYSLAHAPLPDETRRALLVATRHAVDQGPPVRLVFHGARGSGKLGTAAALAGEVGIPLLVVDLDRVATRGGDAERVVELALRDAWLAGAILYIRAFETLGGDEHAGVRSRIHDAMLDAPVIAIVGSARPWTPDGTLFADAMPIAFGALDADRRAAVWRRDLARAGLTADPSAVDAVAGRFRMTSGAIDAAVRETRTRLAWPDPAGAAARVSRDALFAAARSHSGGDLAALATRVRPRRAWSELVLPEDALSQLRELAARAACGPRVLDEWGFRQRMSRGLGVTALFGGPSGTGKTLAAEVIATELGVDLFRVDLAGVVSKYIGETEKNLDRIFIAAEQANGIVLFNESEALFGKRSEVHDAHDRYANIEISYLLQRMEEFDGIAILTTNLRGNLDDAFVRRLAFSVLFPFPDAAHRRQIWAGVFPATVPLAADLDLDALADRFKLSGGNIANIALAAAFHAAHRGSAIAMDDVLHATRREYQKFGKALTAAELGTPAP